MLMHYVKLRPLIIPDCAPELNNQAKYLAKIPILEDPDRLAISIFLHPLFTGAGGVMAPVPERFLQPGLLAALG